MTHPDNYEPNEAEKLFMEQALAYYRDMRAVARNAPDGHVLRLIDDFATRKGRELIRKSLESIAQDEVDDFEKKKKQRPAQNVKPKDEIADDEKNRS
jgi:predicted RNA polymerase sigma factor